MRQINLIKTARQAARNIMLVGAALALFGQALPASAGPKFMTESELMATIPGRAISAKSNNGVDWTQKYSAANKQKKGNIDGVFDGKAYKAKWFVKDGQWCENWGDGQACWMVERTGSKTLRLYENGKPKKNLWNLK
jgi:hypothetical protein